MKTNHHSFPEKILEEESLGEDEMEKLLDNKKKGNFGNKKRKNELMIENNSSLMMEKLGNSIKKTIISKPIVFEKWQYSSSKIINLLILINPFIFLNLMIFFVISSFIYPSK